MVRAGVLDELAARQALEEALLLRQELVVPSAAHVRRVYALRERIRVHDGFYVALADELGCPLITTDLRLAGAYAPCEIRTPPSEPPRHP